MAQPPELSIAPLQRIGFGFSRKAPLPQSVLGRPTLSLRVSTPVVHSAVERSTQQKTQQLRDPASATTKVLTSTYPATGSALGGARSEVCALGGIRTPNLLIRSYLATVADGPTVSHRVAPRTT